MRALTTHTDTGQKAAHEDGIHTHGAHVSAEGNQPAGNIYLFSGANDATVRVWSRHRGSNGTWTCVKV